MHLPSEIGANSTEKTVPLPNVEEIKAKFICSSLKAKDY